MLMEESVFYKVKNQTTLSCFWVFYARSSPQRAMPVALWRTVLLLSLLGVCACLEENCVLGIVGRPVLLPCFYPEISTSVNFSIEWRRDDELVLRSQWTKDGNVGKWSSNCAAVSADAALTGNLSLELTKVDPKEDRMDYSLFIISGGNQSGPVCTVCIRIAAGFSSPQLWREEATQGGETSFLCHSTGGFPEPAVYWLINDTERPPEGSVKTVTEFLPVSHFYNITSHLTVNISKGSSVSCTIENVSMNQTLTSTSYGAQGSPVISRASQGMWMFSTGLCVVVGIMVMAGVAYQIHLDRISRRKKDEFYNQYRGHKRRQYELEEETEEVKLESKETDV